MPRLFKKCTSHGRRYFSIKTMHFGGSSRKAVEDKAINHRTTTMDMLNVSVFQ